MDQGRYPYRNRLVAASLPNMSAQSPGQQQQQSAFKAFVASALRPKQSRNKLRKKTSTTSLVGFASRDDNLPPLPPLAPLQAHRAKYRDAAARMDTQLGENKDYTAMIQIGRESWREIV